jgi:ABC-type multidrug transport system ATPase subunit
MKNCILYLPEYTNFFYFSGESGAGKSSFLNLLIGSDINPIDHSLNATLTICELHNNDRVADAEICYGPDHLDVISGTGTTQEIKHLDTNNPKSAQQTLAQYTIGTERTKRKYDLVKIRWPIPMLQVHVLS